VSVFFRLSHMTPGALTTVSLIRFGSSLPLMSGDLFIDVHLSTFGGPFGFQYSPVPSPVFNATYFALPPLLGSCERIGWIGRVFFFPFPPGPLIGCT